MKFIVGYFAGCGLVFNFLVFLVFVGYQVTITTPHWWITFLQGLGFIVEFYH